VNTVASSNRRGLAITLLAVTCAISGCAVDNSRASEPPIEGSWDVVPLEGMHLRLVSPKASGRSEDLRFGKKGSLAVEACSDQACTHPLTVWKIEDNRLKTGFVPDEGSVLLEYSADRVVMRKPDGRVFTYSVVRD
jgi:hypothetical protein